MAEAIRWRIRLRGVDRDASPGVKRRPRHRAHALLALPLACLAILAMAGSAHCERRLALVLSVSQYASVEKLKNTNRDGRLVAETLKQLHFSVTRVEDANLASLRAALAEFAFQAEAADVALVYFAGHGMEAGGQNYLLPVDVESTSRKAASESAVSLDELLASVDKARQLRIVILDSCRNDPFADSEAKVTLDADNPRRAGLAPASPERGTLVVYAARDGQVAFDGSGDNSPFAIALSRTLPTPDLEIGLMFRRVRDAVLEQTDNEQEPHTYGSLSGNPFFLAGKSQSVNQLEKEVRRNAWSKLEVDQEAQLAALAEDGDTRALKGLAYMRLDPNEKRHDPRQAAQFLEKAAGAGDAEAIFELGQLYEKGIGVEQDVARAIELYEKAAAADFADAINDLGFLYFSGGTGVRKDMGKAIGFFRRAAELRQPEAMFNYAALIDDGEVAGKGPEDAAGYLYEALRSGNAEVLDQLTSDPEMFKPATRAALQRKLASRSLYQGEIDGKFGPQTRRGIERAYGIEN